MGQDYAPAASLRAQPPLRDRTAVLHPGRHAPLMRWNRSQILIDSAEITPCHHAVDWPGHDLQDGSDLWAKRFRHGELRTLAPRFRLRDSASQSETAQGGEERTRRADEDARSLTPGPVRGLSSPAAIPPWPVAWELLPRCVTRAHPGPLGGRYALCARRCPQGGRP